MPLLCRILSQDRIVYEGEVESVLLPGSEGQMEILPRHAPLLTQLQAGVVRLRLREQEEYFTVFGGVAEVAAESVTILTDAAENVEEIDVERAEAARQRAERRLAERIPDEDTYLRMRAALRRADLRLQAVKRYRHGPRRPGRISS
jgi:F-type H+-transporting ATPase subunit epsilon